MPSYYSLHNNNMILLIGLSLAVIVLGDCSEKCQEPTLLYEDLQCKPVFAAPEDCCPVQFDCSHIEERSKKNEEACYFHGKTYALGETINNDETDGNCQADCTCIKGRSNNMGFNCAVYDCPEWFSKLSPGCHYRTNLNECCDGGDEICPPFAATCKVGENIYNEGQEFDDPNDKCVQCVCDKGFDNKFEAPFCKRRSCNEEVSYQTYIKNHCAPSYVRKDDCCPLTWICPEDDFSLPDGTVSGDSDLHCKFGNHKLAIGATFSRTHGDNGKLACECRIPPFLTCIQTYEYPFFAPEL